MNQCHKILTTTTEWKMHGRVGDSPIIGAGLFLDNEVGGAAATGLGEAVIRTAGSAMVVELMRQGKSPFEACKEIVERIFINRPNTDDVYWSQDYLPEKTAQIILIDSTKIINDTIFRKKNISEYNLTLY